MAIDPIAVGNMFAQMAPRPIDPQTMGANLNVLAQLKHEADSQKLEQALKDNLDVGDAATALAQSGGDPEAVLKLKAMGQENALKRIQLSDMATKAARDVYGLTPENYPAHYAHMKQMETEFKKAGLSDPGFGNLPDPSGDPKAIRDYIDHSQAAVSAHLANVAGEDFIVQPNPKGGSKYTQVRHPTDRLVPTTGDAGDTVYTPSSQAAGMRVGARPSGRLYPVLTGNNEQRDHLATWETPEDARGQRVGSRSTKTAGPTASQQAENEEIDASREAIAGLTRTEIVKRTQAQTQTGRDNPDYDPMLAGTVRKALRRKVGVDDSGFNELSMKFHGIDAGTAPGPRTPTAPQKAPKDMSDAELLQALGIKR